MHLGTLSRHKLQVHIPAQPADNIGDGIQTHSLTTVSPDLGPGGKSRQKEQLGSIMVAQRARFLFTHQTSLHSQGTHFSHIYPTSCVNNTHHHPPLALCCSDNDGPLARFTCLFPLFRGFNSVVHRVAEQVHQGILQGPQHLPVNKRFFALDDQTHLLT